MDENDLALMHESVHADYRKELAAAQWELAQSKAREKIANRKIAELTALIDEATKPEQHEH